MVDEICLAGDDRTLPDQFREAEAQRDRAQQGWAWALTERNRERGRAEAAERKVDEYRQRLHETATSLHRHCSGGASGDYHDCINYQCVRNRALVGDALRVEQPRPSPNIAEGNTLSNGTIERVNNALLKLSAKWREQAQNETPDEVSAAWAYGLRGCANDLDRAVAEPEREAPLSPLDEAIKAEEEDEIRRYGTTVHAFADCGPECKHGPERKGAER